MKLKIAICDDEPVFCESAKSAISELKEAYEIDIYHTADNICKTDEKYDAIFLDIEMPGENGIDIAFELRSKGYRGEIIFLTSHSKYMPDAFKVRAFRFLIKPINKNDLEETLEQLEREMKNTEIISVDSFGKEHYVYVKNIVYIEAKKKNTILHLNDVTIIETSNSLKYWLEILLDNDFCQIHKSYIVSLKYLSLIENDEVTLSNYDVILPLSRRRYSDVKKKYFDYVRTNSHIL